MPNKKKSEHTAKADRMAEHIEKDAKKEGRYKGREREVAWRKVHKELSHEESHLPTGNKKSK